MKKYFIQQLFKIVTVSIVVVCAVFVFTNNSSAQVAPPAGTRTDYSVGNYPIDIALDNITNSIWVTNYYSNTISKVNINTGERVDYTVGKNPIGVAFDSVTNSVWVANQLSNTVSKVDIHTGTKIDYAVGYVYGGNYPEDVAFDNATNSVWVTHQLSNIISKVDIYTGTKIDYVTDKSSGAAFDDITNSVWVTHHLSNTVSKMDIYTGTKIDYAVGDQPTGVAFDNVTNSVWVANTHSRTVSKININTGARSDYPVEGYPTRVAFDDVTNSIWVTNYSSNTISKININTGDRVSYITSNGPIGVTFDNVTNSVWFVNAKSNMVSKMAIGDPWPSQQMRNPTDSGTLKQGFDPTRNHYGIDVDKTLNQKPVKSPAKGTIVRIDDINDSPAGKWIWVSHGSITRKDGTIAEKISTRYLHMDTIATSTYVGKQVEQGEILGTVGTTGVSTAPHLHFEVRQGDISPDLNYRLTTALDPLFFVNYTKSAFSVSVYSPVDIIVTDPDGLILSKSQNDFGVDADYFELTESDGDNTIEYEIASVDQLKSGDYLISVVPEPRAQPDDVYTIKTTVCGTTVSLSENTPVKYIPDTSYIVRTNGCSIERIIPIKIITSPVGSHYLLNSNLEIQFQAIDNIFGTASISATLNGVTVNNNQVATLDKPGSNVLIITATDNNGNVTTLTKTFTVNYHTAGFLPPIKADGSGVYNQGRTLPVKFVLNDVNGMLAPMETAYLYIAKISNNVVGSDEIALATNSPDTGNQFRYDGQGMQYIFNLSTDTMSAGSWQIKAILGNGQEIVGVVSIK